MFFVRTHVKVYIVVNNSILISTSLICTGHNIKNKSGNIYPSYYFLRTIFCWCEPQHSCNSKIVSLLQFKI